MDWEDIKEKVTEAFLGAFVVGLFLFVVCFMHTVAHKSSEFMMDKFLGLFKTHHSLLEDTE